MRPGTEDRLLVLDRPIELSCIESGFAALGRQPEHTHVLIDPVAKPGKLSDPEYGMAMADPMISTAFVSKDQYLIPITRENLLETREALCATLSLGGLKGLTATVRGRKRAAGKILRSLSYFEYDLR